MNPESPQPGISSGEARIRSAFRRSLLAVGALVLVTIVIITAVFYLAEREDSTVTEAIVVPPAAPSAEYPSQPPPVSFTDITAEAGIDFVHVNGAYGERLMPETIGSGAAFFDYDNDGDQDLFLVNSSYWPDHRGDANPRQYLYANDGRGRFEDVTESAGLAVDLYGMGVAVGDFDDDGWIDLFLTAVGENRLFRNEQGHFRDATQTAGVSGRASDWSTAAAFLDYDNDGDLDLFVGNYVKWSREIDLEIDFRLTGLGRAYGAPNHFAGTDNRLYRNDGEGRFQDVSRSAGVTPADPVSGNPIGKTLAVAPVDYDRDGYIDLFVANDTVRNFLLRNRGDGTFEEIGAFEGVAYDRNGKATGAMGIDSAYFRNDADLGVAIGNFANEMSSLYVTAGGQPPFADEAVIEGLGPASRLALTFGLFFFDYDLDGRLDLFQANGHLEREINRVQPSQQYAQPAQLFWNCGGGCPAQFIEAGGTGALAEPMVGRGAAYGDIDGDGDLDLVITQSGRRAVLLRNEQDLGHHWLRVKLEGNTRNRNAIGARLTLTANGVTQTRIVVPTRSFLSQVELPVTFGLGDSEAVERLEVRWPDGTTEEVPVPGVDTTLVIRQEPPA